MRNYNRAAVWEVVRARSPISLSDLALQVPLSRVTLSSITREMVQVGLLTRCGVASSSGGRPSALFCYLPSARFAVGVTMFDRQITAVLTDLEGIPVRVLQAPWNESNPESLLAAMTDAVQNLTADIPRRRVLGVGVGLPGIIDVPSGRVLLCVSMGWFGRPIEARKILENALGLPVHVANRSRIAALGELRAGVGKGSKSLLYMFIGRGVILGIAFEDGIYTGATSTAGEIGHSTFDPNGPLCRCGNHGCLELYTSENALLANAIARARVDTTSQLREIAQGNLQALTLDALIRCARRGDPASLAAFEEVGNHLGIALAAALNMFNPEILVIGGPVGCRSGGLLLDPTRREIERRTLAMTLSAVKIVSGEQDQEIAAIGAANLALDALTIDQLFDSTEA